MAKKNQHPSGLSGEEMEQQAQTLEKEIFTLRNEFAVHRRHEKPHLLKAKRHERARLLTLMTQQRRNAQ